MGGSDRKEADRDRNEKEEAGRRGRRGNNEAWAVYFKKQKRTTLTFGSNFRMRDAAISKKAMRPYRSEVQGVQGFQ